MSGDWWPARTVYLVARDGAYRDVVPIQERDPGDVFTFVEYRRNVESMSRREPPGQTVIVEAVTTYRALSEEEVEVLRKAASGGKRGKK